MKFHLSALHVWIQVTINSTRLLPMNVRARGSKLSGIWNTGEKVRCPSFLHPYPSHTWVASRYTVSGRAPFNLVGLAS